MNGPIDRVLDCLATGLPLPLGSVPRALRPLVEALLAGPLPKEALLNLRKIAALRSGGAEWPSAGVPLSATASVLSSGPGLTDLIARRPARFDLLQSPSVARPRSAEELRLELSTRLPEDDLELTLEQAATAIAEFRNDHYVRLAACEFGLASLEQVGVELSQLADVCVEGALRQAVALNRRRLSIDPDDDPSAGLVAIAMGKHGAQELNFCSDIDLVFLYRSDEAAFAGESAHEFQSHVCRDIVRLLSGAEGEGIAFRVDLRLRPEGSRGPICNSLGSAERYYETWGGPYDRLAWLKARSAAGDIALGDTIIELLQPFVFPRSTSWDLVEQIRQLSERIRAELGSKRKLVDGWNVKLGEGGIRDVEFFTQALQLVHGGKTPTLRCRTTLTALERLFFSGFISEHERRALGESYELFRRIEHRLQLHAGRQTHHLPQSGSLRAHVIAHLGYDEQTFSAELRRCREVVASIYATLGAADPGADGALELLGFDVPVALAEARLAEAGFADPSLAWEQIQLLREKPWGPFTPTAPSRLRALGSALLREVADSPNPDGALHHLVSMALLFGPFEGAWLMLAEHPEAARLLCNLFGSSEFLATLFIRQPELIDQLLLAGRATRERSAAEMSHELDERLAGAELEQCFSALEKFRNEEVLRIGLHDIANDSSLEVVWSQLSALAELILRRLYGLVYGEVTRRHGQPRRADGALAQMAVVGLGKLGGREMSYGSDLDLIFIYSSDGQSDGARPIDNSEFFAKVAQRLIRALTSGFAHGSLYQVDTRLRPSGSQGTLVSSLSAFERYHQEHAQIWERQTLTKARVVAGDEHFGEHVQGWIEGFLYGEMPAPERLRDEMVRLRARIERELAEEDAGQVNLKLGRGGILDVEFIAQYIQLCFGARAPALRACSTMTVLQGAREVGLLEEELAETLVQGYRFLRRLEGRLRVVRGRSAERMTTSPADLEQVARRLGYRRRGQEDAGAQLLAHYLENTRAVRRTYERILALPAT